MKTISRIDYIMCVIFILTLVISWIGITSAVEYNNTGLGKPKGMDLYIGDIPYSSSLGGNEVNTTQKGVGDFKVIVDDNKAGKSDPDWFPNLGVTTTSTPTSTSTPTPTMTPTPTATAVIEIDTGGVGAQLCTLDNTSDVIVDFAFSDAGYTNVFKLSSPRSVTLGNSKTTAFGKIWNLGKFAAGQKLIFADTANGVTYYTGPNSSNPDNRMHAAVTLKNQTGTYHKYLVSFEDYYGGGDNDYNDVEFYVNGNLSTGCSSTTTIDESSDDSGGGALSPKLVDVCKCGSKYKDHGWGEDYQCVAYVTYTNTAGVDFEIPIKSTSKPWNEFTGSGMVDWDRCQPTTFYADPSKITPFWTNPFWNNLQWKLGYDHSILIKCTKDTSQCKDTSVCNGCL